MKTTASELEINGRVFTLRGKLARKIQRDAKTLGIQPDQAANLALASGLVKSLVERRGALPAELRRLANSHVDVLISTAFRAGMSSLHARP